MRVPARALITMKLSSIFTQHLTKTGAKTMYFTDPTLHTDRRSSGSSVDSGSSDQGPRATGYIHSMTRLPVSDPAYLVPQVYAEGDLEATQALTSNWTKAEVCKAWSGLCVARVWVTVGNREYMIEEAGDNLLVTGFAPETEVHISVILVLRHMIRRGVAACRVWNLPGSNGAACGGRLSMCKCKFSQRPRE